MLEVMRFRHRLVSRCEIVCLSEFCDRVLEARFGQELSASENSRLCGVLSRSNYHSGRKALEVFDNTAPVDRLRELYSGQGRAQKALDFFVAGRRYKKHIIKSTEERRIQRRLNVRGGDKQTWSVIVLHELEQRVNNARRFANIAGAHPGAGDGIAFVQQQDARTLFGCDEDVAKVGCRLAEI